MVCIIRVSSKNYFGGIQWGVYVGGGGGGGGGVN